MGSLFSPSLDLPLPTVADSTLKEQHVHVYTAARGGGEAFVLFEGDLFLFGDAAPPIAVQPHSGQSQKTQGLFKKINKETISWIGSIGAPPSFLPSCPTRGNIQISGRNINSGLLKRASPIKSVPVNPL